MLDRISRLESQVASANFKLKNLEENHLTPSAILRKVREAEAKEKRASEKEDIVGLLGAQPPEMR